MRLFIILVVIGLLVLLSGCGRSNSENYYCNKEQLENVEKLVDNCAKGILSNRQGCWHTIVKNVCTYKE